jgi:hypothetical protein
MIEVLKDKADEFAQSKNRVHFAIEGLDDQGKPRAGTQISVTPSAAKGRTVPKEGTEFATALEQTARGEAQVWDKYGPVPDKGRRLTERAETLRGSIDTEFASKAKREEVRRELEAAKTVIGQIVERTDKVVTSSTTFLKQGNELLAAAATAEIKPPAKGAKGKSGKTAPPPGKSKDKDKDKDKDATPKPPPAKPAPAPAAEKQPSANTGSSGDFNP